MTCKPSPSSATSDAAPPLDDYEAWCAAKLRLPAPAGVSAPPSLCPALKPFQADCTGWALERGRSALFEDCGLGKTLQQLAWAQAIVEHTGGRVLILAPLAVAGQTVREGQKFGIPVTYARTKGEQAKRGITITNYERLDAFDPADFAGVVLDESSILKSFMGATKRRLLEAFARTPFRLACTATPAPNDHMELGNHAEFLGILTSHEMLARWFLNDTSAMGTYKLKGHAVEPFWDWVSSWARCLGSPADLGYDATGYVLPDLVQRVHTLDVDVTEGRAKGQLFRQGGLSATKLHQEKRLTLATRAAKMAELVTSEPGESWILWCDTDYEDEALRAVLPDAVSVRGSDSLDSKERALLGFADGSIRVLITKPRIAGFGLNWQHCARVGYVGPSFSYEAYYQTVRRTWRFGQTRPVHVHVAMGRTEVEVWQAMQRKAADHEAMKVEMFAAMRRAREARDEQARIYKPTRRAALPSWITSGAVKEARRSA